MTQAEATSGLRYLEVIVKMTERCNINCDYCYVFNRGNNQWKQDPPVIRPDVLTDLADFLAQGAQDIGIKTVQIDFHGGEPLLMKKTRFDAACAELTDTVGPHANVRFALQTNGMLVDDDWLALFEKHRVHASVSLDGPPAMNDAHRIDHKGRGTYAQSVAGLRRLQSAHVKGRTPVAPGLLCVINPEFDGAEIYRHFVHDLGLKGIDFILPDLNHDEIDDAYVERLGDYIVAVFDAWAVDDDKSVDIRLFASQMRVLLGAPASFIGFAAGVSGALAFTVGSEGSIYVDDTLRSTGHEVFSSMGKLKDLTVRDVMNSPQTRLLERLSYPAPTCTACVWSPTCAGGRLVNRLSRDNGFDNPSVFCGALRRMYSRLTAYLVNSGIPIELIESNLGLRKLEPSAVPAPVLTVA